jgi:hypothetical protein
MTTKLCGRSTYLLRTMLNLTDLRPAEWEFYSNQHIQETSGRILDISVTEKILQLSICAQTL